jgi:flavorubredoxin
VESRDTVRFWPQKRWKKILLIALLAVIITLALFSVYAGIKINSDVLTPLVVKNPEGAKTALVLFHPGLSSFSQDVSYAFADGLVSNDWRVEITTPSSEAPTDLSKYSLLVITSNTYAFTPDPPTTRHLKRIGDLNGIQTVLLTLGAGSAEGSKQALENLVKASNGTITESLLLYNIAPNEGDKSATEIARQIAQQIT